jgi:hypothetical protein
VPGPLPPVYVLMYAARITGVILRRKSWDGWKWKINRSNWNFQGYAWLKYWHVSSPSHPPKCPPNQLLLRLDWQTLQHVWA